MKINHSSLDRLAKVLFFIVLRLLIAGTVITLLWNWLMPAVVNAVPINFLQGIGLMLLGRLLTGSLNIGVGLSTLRKKNNTDDDFLDDNDTDDDEHDINHKARLRDDLRERCKTTFGQKKNGEV